MSKLTLPRNPTKRHETDADIIDTLPHTHDEHLSRSLKRDEKIAHNSSVEELLNEIERQKDIIKL